MIDNTIAGQNMDEDDEYIEAMYDADPTPFYNHDLNLHQMQEDDQSTHLYNRTQNDVLETLEDMTNAINDPEFFNDNSSGGNEIGNSLGGFTRLFTDDEPRTDHDWEYSGGMNIMATQTEEREVDAEAESHEEHLDAAQTTHADVPLVANLAASEESSDDEDEDQSSGLPTDCANCHYKRPDDATRGRYKGRKKWKVCLYCQREVFTGDKWIGHVLCLSEWKTFCTS